MDGGRGAHYSANKYSLFTVSSPKWSLQDKKKMLEIWEAVFFTINNQKHDFEEMFSKDIHESENELYISWLPLKLGAVGQDIREFSLKKY